MVFRLRGERFLPTRQAHKRVDTKVSTLLRITHFLRGHGADCRHVTVLNRGTAEEFFFRRDALRALMYPHIRSVGYLSATQTSYSTQARHTRVAQLYNALYRMAPAN